MISKVFTVYDMKAEAYLNPFMFQNKGEAIRAFQDAVNDPKTMFYKHPEDYALFQIAEYDDQTAKYTPLQNLQSLGVAIEFKKVLPYLGLPEGFKESKNNVDN